MMSHSEVSAVGIDVAKTTLSVCLRLRNGTEGALSIRNIEADIRKKLLPALERHSGKVVLESTGHYHWLVALLLQESGQDVRIVNPLLSKQYTAANIRKVKTDPADAVGLARMAAMADNLPHSFTLSRDMLHARKKLGLLAALVRERQALTSSLRSVQEANTILGRSDSAAEQAVAEAIRTLRKSIGKLEREIEHDAVSRDTAGTISLLATIPGVSVLTAGIAAHWFDGTIGATLKAWIAYAGLDVSSRESGTWHGRCHLTKRGNNYLRSRLFSAAWGAVMHDADMKAYYDRLRTKGRSHVEALVIIARKIVRIMFCVMEHRTPYDSSELRSVLSA